MSRVFGRNRQAQSEDEKTRHVGVVFKDLTVKGVGLGVALQPTLGDLFLKLPRFIGGLFSNPSRATGKPPIQTLINDFSGCIRPGRCCSCLAGQAVAAVPFLKVLANQRFAYKSVEGEVTYGGTSAKKMGKEYASEVVYNPEDDLHYATLSVKNTLKFALGTRTPGKASRNEGESNRDYVTPDPPSNSRKPTHRVMSPQLIYETLKSSNSTPKSNAASAKRQRQKLPKRRITRCHSTNRF